MLQVLNRGSFISCSALQLYCFTLFLRKMSNAGSSLWNISSCCSFFDIYATKWRETCCSELWEFGIRRIQPLHGWIDRCRGDVSNTALALTASSWLHFSLFHHKNNSEPLVLKWNDWCVKLHFLKWVKMSENHQVRATSAFHCNFQAIDGTDELSQTLMVFFRLKWVIYVKL